MRKRLLIPWLLVALPLTACGGRGPTADSGVDPAVPMPSEVVVVETENGPVLVDPARSSVLFGRRLAVAGPGARWLYRASPEGDTTLLRTFDGRTGRQMSTARVDGALEVRVASASGRAVALMDPLPPGTEAWTPVPRARTTVVVVDPSGSRQPRVYRLDGNFEPEAFSTDDSRLFMIQYLPPMAPGVYRVTELDLATGTVTPVPGHFTSPSERMPGTRLSQTAGADGRHLYTLYTSEPPSYANRYGTAPTVAQAVSFIHVLNMEEGWAHCAGLPRELWDRPPGSQAIVTSRDGDRLYTVDGQLGLVSVMDLRRLGTVRTQEVELSSRGKGISVAISGDGERLFLASRSGAPVIDVVDTASLDVVKRWPMPRHVVGMSVSGDGKRLHLATRDGISVVDASTGRHLTSFPLPRSGGVTGISATHSA